MKRIVVLFAMAVLFFCGCNKDQIGNKASEEGASSTIMKPIKFTSYASESDKTVESKVEINGYDLKFSVGERMAVVSYNFASETTPLQKDYAVFDGSTASASGTFTPSEHNYGEEWAGTASAVSFYSFYPSPAAAPTITKTNATVTNIAAEQDGTLSSIVCWAKGSNVATADEVKDGSAPSFNYSPVCALLKLSIVNNDNANATSLSSIVLRAKSGNNIAGNAILNLLTGAISAAPSGSSSSVAYTPASALQLAKDGGSTTVYLSLIPTTITSIDFAFTDSRSGAAIDYAYTASLNKDLPAALLPGRLYERTLTISSIIPTSVSGSAGTCAGVKFVRGFLNRTSPTTTTVSDMLISDATTNPLEILDYTNQAASADSYNMYFAFNELLTIMGGASGSSFESNTISISGSSYKVASKANLEALTSTTRSNAATINGSEKAWSCVKVTLTDSKAACGTDYYNRGFSANTTSDNFIKGLLFFPDGATVSCNSINAANCDIFTKELIADPSTITSSQLKVLVKGGCLFMPFVGGHTNTPTWNSRGGNGYLWTSTYTTGSVILVIDGSSTPASINTTTYSAKRHFPVMLVDVN